jgi:hypothetical protein
MQTASNRSNDFSKFNAALEASTHIYADYERAKVEQELARDGITSPESGWAPNVSEVTGERLAPAAVRPLHRIALPFLLGELERLR